MSRVLRQESTIGVGQEGVDPGRSVVGVRGGRPVVSYGRGEGCPSVFLRLESEEGPAIHESDGVLHPRRQDGRRLDKIGRLPVKAQVERPFA